jgi:hypothetical protein
MHWFPGEPQMVLQSVTGRFRWRALKREYPELPSYTAMGEVQAARLYLTQMPQRSFEVAAGTAAVAAVSSPADTMGD